MITFSWWGESEILAWYYLLFSAFKLLQDRISLSSAGKYQALSVGTACTFQVGKSFASFEANSLRTIPIPHWLLNKQQEKKDVSHFR